MSESARAALDAAMTEAELAALVEEMLHRGGYHFYHPFDPRRAATILDYYCWKDRAFWIELKTMTGKLSADRWVIDKFGRHHFVTGQQTVIAELRAAGQTVYVWRPSDVPEIARILLGEGVHVL
jgi:hypothetical protein